jgi:predicted alpha/beta-hydrolase family hydrolase
MPAASNFEPLFDRDSEPNVRGYLHRPENSAAGLILAHGAGTNAQARLLIALAEAFCAAGVTVLRVDLPYRQLRPHGPPGLGDAGRDREGLKNAVAAVRKLVPGRIFLGGHSYGGRQASMLCAAAPELVNGLLLLSYPLHPPRKPEQLRVQHLPNLRNPCLFVHGTRDPFGSVGEIQQALQLIPAETRVLAVEGVGHDLNFKKGKAGGDLTGEVVSGFQDFFRPGE